MTHIAMTLVVAAVALIVLSGCDGAPVPPPSATPVAIDCEQESTEHSRSPTRLPSDFDPVAAYVCDPYRGLDDDDPTSLDYSVTTLRGDLTALIRAFATPDDPRTTQACTLDQRLVPLVWMADADGDVVRLAYPEDFCGKPKSDPVSAAIAELSV